MIILGTQIEGLIKKKFKRQLETPLLYNTTYWFVNIKFESLIYYEWEK
jgi:competence protein ComGF